VFSNKILNFLYYYTEVAEDVTSQLPDLNEESAPCVPLAPKPTVRKISRSCPNGTVQASVVDVGDLMESQELAELSNQLNEFSVMKPKIASMSPHTFSSTYVSNGVEESADEDSWEKLYNETGDLLRPDALEEVRLYF
jgi:negative regulator of replication initiation